MAPFTALCLVAGDGIAEAQPEGVEIGIRSQGEQELVSLFFAVQMSVTLEEINVKRAFTESSLPTLTERLNI